MPHAIIKPDRFVFGSVKYFRGKSEDVTLGCYGTKKKPPTGANHLDVASELSNDALGRLPVSRIEVDTETNWSGSVEADLNPGGLLKFLDAAGGAAKFSRHQAISADLKLVKLSVRFQDIAHAINGHDANALRFLKSKNARIVSAVWVVVDGTISSSLESATSLSLAKSGASLSVNLGSGSNSKVTLAPGTTFAYLLHEVSKWSGDKKAIEFMKQDQIGFG